jgi:G-protein alpha subunit.
MCFGGREKRVDEVGAARSRDIDKMIKADEKRMQREMKFLLLGTNSSPLLARVAIPLPATDPSADLSVYAGAGESGKSTVLKQMKLIYAQGFSKHEKMEWKPVVFANIIQSFRLIYDAMNEMGIKFENPENEARIPAL